jgi:hypothetical protein
MSIAKPARLNVFLMQYIPYTELSEKLMFNIAIAFQLRPKINDYKRSRRPKWIEIDRMTSA